MPLETGWSVQASGNFDVGNAPEVPAAGSGEVLSEEDRAAAEKAGERALELRAQLNDDLRAVFSKPEYGLVGTSMGAPERTSEEMGLNEDGSLTEEAAKEQAEQHRGLQN